MTVIADTFDWILHPTFDTDTDEKDWALGLVVIVCVAFLWSRVIKGYVE